MGWLEAGNSRSMLSVAEEHLVGMNPSARLVLSGQELNPESYAICKADTLGFAGRFGPGLPRVRDGSLLFTGGAGSGGSEIRPYVLENDLVEAIIGLPTDMFSDTGISTYVWILSNRKPEECQGKVQLIDASSFWQKMRKSLGSMCKGLSPEHIEEITRLFGSFVEAEKDGKPISKIFRNEDFGYRTITVERPLRDEAGNVVPGQRGKAKGQPQPDSSLRDTENVPLSDDEQTYFERDKTKVGYEIPFNRHFYVFTPPRPWR